jgi:hypothetical protein
MIKRTTLFEIPNEMRAVVEQSVEQAKRQFDASCAWQSAV